MKNFQINENHTKKMQIRFSMGSVKYIAVGLAKLQSGLIEK